MSAGPTSARPPYGFSAKLRVGFDETDAQAVVYYGRYFPYFDRARVEYQRHLGLLHSLPPGFEFVMRHVSCEYEAPARFDDEIEVFIRTSSIGRTSWRWEMAVHECDSGELLAHAEQVMVLIDRAARAPEPVPDHIRDAVSAFEGSASSIDARVQAVIDGGEEADEILRASLAAVHEGAGAPWSAIAFVEEGQMAIGPVAGTAPDDAPAPALAVPIVYRGDTVAALWLGSAPGQEIVAELERAAALLAPYCLVGWDTGGEEWVP